MLFFLSQKGAAVAALGWALSSPVASASPSIVTAALAQSVAAAQLSEVDLRTQVKRDSTRLGSLSLGLPNNGKLFNGVRPKEGKFFELVAEDYSWGTSETVSYLKTAAEAVHEEHENTQPLHLGHISKPTGGYLRPHLSHQSGRDVDLGYYYKKKRAWYRRATWDTLDVPRTWSLVRALIEKTDVELIFIDRSIQTLIRKHAERIGENKKWVRRVFRGDDERPAIIRHTRGHATHMHVRFFSPLAERNAVRAYPFLLKENLIEPVHVFAQHRVRKGETLGRIAKRYGTTVVAIQKANGLRGTMIQARRTYKIPKRGGPAQVAGQVKFYPRVLPPARKPLKRK